MASGVLRCLSWAAFLPAWRLGHLGGMNLARGSQFVRRNQYLDLSRSRFMSQISCVTFTTRITPTYYVLGVLIFLLILFTSK